MEYPMCTLILGEGTQAGLSGVMAHEVSHSWYEMTLASNEALYAWMDEGFTDFASDEAMASVLNETTPPHLSSYTSYFSLVSSGLQEPANQHSDHFSTNRAYGTMAYNMGAVFLEQLKYLIGEENFYKGMNRYYNTWKMKHPEPNDFIRIMEKTSGLQLHWYLRYWINTTKRIDYSIGAVFENEKGTIVELLRLGEFPMPMDLTVTFKDGSKQQYYISLNELLGNKAFEAASEKPTILEPWPWVNPSYSLIINKKIAEIESIEIDPSLRMADVNRKNNKAILSELKPYTNPTK
jgi:aminopeptidase N